MVQSLGGLRVVIDHLYPLLTKKREDFLLFYSRSSSSLRVRRERKQIFNLIDQKEHLTLSLAYKKLYLLRRQ
jgi:hypothetical protein